MRSTCPELQRLLQRRMMLIRQMLGEWESGDDEGSGPDLDNMSYEEILALEERMGKVNVGLKPEELKALDTFEFSRDVRRQRARRTLADANTQKTDSQKSKELEEASCPVCLLSLEDGDMCRALPHCEHFFHQECIDKWLSSANSCPVCRSPVR